MITIYWTTNRVSLMLRSCPNQHYFVFDYAPWSLATSQCETPGSWISWFTNVLFQFLNCFVLWFFTKMIWVMKMFAVHSHFCHKLLILKLFCGLFLIEWFLMFWWAEAVKRIQTVYVPSEAGKIINNWAIFCFYSEAQITRIHPAGFPEFMLFWDRKLNWSDQHFNVITVCVREIYTEMKNGDKRGTGSSWVLSFILCNERGFPSEKSTVNKTAGNLSVTCSETVGHRNSADNS